MTGWLTTVLDFCPDRDAVVGALMPAGMLAPVECSSLASSAPASDASAVASPMNTEEGMLAADLEDRLSPNLWQEKREVKGLLQTALNLKGKEFYSFCHLSFVSAIWFEFDLVKLFYLKNFLVLK